MSSVLLPLLSFLPAIFQVFSGLLISFLHLGHLAIRLTARTLCTFMDKKLSREVLLHGLLIGEIRVIRDESQRAGEGEHQEEECETFALPRAHVWH